MSEAVFYIFAVAAVLGAAMCILQRNPVASAMWLMSTMCSLAAPLFQIYLVPFEITSILLLAAIVGAVVLAKRKI